MTGYGKKKSISLGMVKPIGSIYISINNINPSVLFGGIWEQIENRFIVSSGSTYKNNTMGGSSSINLYHTHTSATHHHGAINTQNGTLEAMIGSTLSNPQNIGFARSNMNACIQSTYKINGGHGSPSSVNNHNTAIHGYTADATPNNTGASLSSSQSIIPPYIAVTVWKRIS